jgi:hypothetical protein
MSMVVRKKPQEETAMEKRDTAILNFTLAALVPLLLMLFLGFSLKEGSLQNEENLEQKFTTLTKKHKELSKSILEMTRVFYRADTLYNSLDKKDYDDIVKQISDIDSEIALNHWDNDRNAVIDRFEHVIDKIKRDRELAHDDTLQQLLVFGAKWLKEIAKAKNDEFSVLKLLRQKELKQAEIVNASGGTDLQAKVQELQMQLMQKDFELKRLEDSKAANEGNAASTNSTLQKSYNKVLDGNKTVKAEIEAELSKINQDILPKLEGGIFKGDDVKRLKDKLKLSVDNIRAKSGNLKIDD